MEELFFKDYLWESGWRDTTEQRTQHPDGKEEGLPDFVVGVEGPDWGISRNAGPSREEETHYVLDVDTRQ